MDQIGFGGGCHWCTEAVFESLEGVVDVKQGWIASDAPHDGFSEAVIVSYNDRIPLEVLIHIHLLTHSSASRHSMREKYRSAVYCFDDRDADVLNRLIERFSEDDDTNYITEALAFREFKLNRIEQLHYYRNNSTAPFCETYINPKLAFLKQKFGKHLKPDF